MHKTRNLFGAKTAQKGFRVSDFMLFLCASCYRIFILQQPLFIPHRRPYFFEAGEDPLVATTVFCPIKLSTWASSSTERA